MVGEAGKKAEAKKPEDDKKEEKEEKTVVEEKPKEEEDNKADDNKDAKEEQPPPPPPPPEIVMRVFMHCEGCARKVRCCLKGFEGVEEVTTDCRMHKVVVKGEKADPLKVLDRVQKKTHKQVELLSPMPKPATEEVKKPEEIEPPKPEVIIEEPKVITVVLKVHMHCEACSLGIKRRIERMKEVKEAIPDLKSSEVTVKGTFEPSKLVEYIYKRTGKRAVIVKQDPPPEKNEDADDKGKDGKEENKGEGAGEEGKKGGEEEKGDKKDGGGGEGGDGDGKAAGDGGDEVATVEEGAKVVEFRRNEYQYYPPRCAMEMHAYPPEIFSDENPNACSIM
ncbi:hypothetical protein vseg_020963 [Gypsophila vaccaria]